MQIACHGIDVVCQLTQFVVPVHIDRLPELATTEPLDTDPDRVQRSQQPAHIAICQYDHQQQRHQRASTEQPRLAAPGQVAQAQDDAVAVAGLALEQARCVVVPAPFPMLPVALVMDRM